VLGLDLGGTEVKAALVEETGNVLVQRRAASGERGGVASWRDTALAAARSVRAATPPGGEPAALGLSVPGAVDPARAVLVDLVDRLRSGGEIDLALAFSALGLPVLADNDARAALAAERRWGVARGADDVVMLTIGTGLGGAALVGGTAPGADPVLAGNQLGHLSIDLDGDRCVCGNRGCAELLASASGLVALAARAGLEAADAKAVLAADEAGDERARAAVDRFLVALAAAVVNAVHAYQPALVVLGGGVMGSARRVLPAVRSLVAERAWTLPRGRTRVEASALGGSIGVLGAAAVALAGLDTTAAVPAASRELASRGRIAR
jgi:glucokinase